MKQLVVVILVTFAVSAPVFAGANFSVNANSPAPTDPFVAKGAKLLNDSAAASQFFDRDSSPAFSQNGLGSIQGFLNNPSDIATVTKALDDAMKSAANA